MTIDKHMLAKVRAMEDAHQELLDQSMQEIVPLVGKEMVKSKAEEVVIDERTVHSMESGTQKLTEELENLKTKGAKRHHSSKRRVHWGVLLGLRGTQNVHQGRKVFDQLVDEERGLVLVA